MADMTTAQIPAAAIERAQRKLNQLKAAGRDVQPWEYSAIYKAELDALYDQMGRNRALDLEQNRQDMQSAMFREELGMKKDAMDAQQSAGLMSGIGSLATTGLTVDYLTGGKVKDYLTGLVGLGKKNPTVPDSVALTGGAEVAPEAASVTTGPVMPAELTLEGGTGMVPMATEGVLAGSEIPASLLATGAATPLAATATTPLVSTAAGSASPLFASPSAVITGADFGSGAAMGAAGLEAPAAGATATGTAVGTEAAAEGAGSIGASTVAAPAAIGFGVGKLGLMTGAAEKVSDFIGVGGKHEAASGMGALAGAGAGFAMGGPVGAVVGAIAGLVGGSSLLDDCILYSFLFGRHSHETRYAKVFCYRFMTEETLLGYYQSAARTRAWLERHPQKIPGVKKVATRFVAFMRWKLGREKTISVTTKLMSYGLLKLFRVVHVLTDPGRQFTPMRTCIPMLRNRAHKGVL